MSQRAHCASFQALNETVRKRHRMTRGTAERICDLQGLCVNVLRNADWCVVPGVPTPTEQNPTLFSIVKSFHPPLFSLKHHQRTINKLLVCNDGNVVKFRRLYDVALRDPIAAISYSVSTLFSLARDCTVKGKS